jgi:phosphatidylserine/phosphatidylglycerophosphate/cardiolipin synthase-like enzyme
MPRLVRTSRADGHEGESMMRAHLGLMTTVALALGLAYGCGSGARPSGADGGTPDGHVPPPPVDGDVPVDAPPPPPPPPVAQLEIYSLDLWAQQLPADVGTLSVTLAGSPVDFVGFPVATIDLRDAAIYDVALAAPDHESLHVSVDFDGTGALAGMAVRTFADAVGQGISVSHELRVVEGRTIPVHTVYLGLRHQWFSAQGRPARRGNDLRLMMDGEEAWSTVATDLRAATDDIMVSTWWWQSDFELERDAATHVTSTLAERESNTILGILDASYATKRVLVGQFLSADGTLSTLTVDAPLTARGEAVGDGFEYMGQANPTAGVFDFAVPPFIFGERVLAERPETASRPFEAESFVESEIPPRTIDLTDWPAGISIEVAMASYHQKFMIVDSNVAFIGGMNLRAVDWDTSDHLYYEPRRMGLTSSTANRLDVQAGHRDPDTGPRKDYMVRIEGPIAEDAADVFHERWQYLLGAGARYSANSSDFTVASDLPPVPGGVQAQVTATLPEPFYENAIAETWFNAVGNAQDYIYIEDQYFRIPMLVDLIIERMYAIPTLKLVVITKPINEWTDPGCAWSYVTNEELATRFPTRYQLLQFKSFDTEVVCTLCIDETESRYANMDTHAKILIVDDVFLSVGSANKNNRGIVYEGELNVAVFDAAWVNAARRRIFANFLPPGTPPTDDSDVWFTQISDAAAWNQYVLDNWTDAANDINLNGAPLPDQYTPSGFVYPLVFRALTDCLMETIGPDMV